MTGFEKADIDLLQVFSFSLKRPVAGEPIFIRTDVPARCLLILAYGFASKTVPKVMHPYSIYRHMRVLPAPHRMTATHLNMPEVTRRVSIGWHMR